MNRSRIAALLAMLVLSASMLSACNTMQGAGEDVEQGGEEIQDAAD